MNLIPINNYAEILNLTTSTLNPTYSKFNFLAENYFCIYQKNHEIPLQVLNMLKNFYTTNNEIMLNINNQLETTYNVPDKRNEFLNDMFSGGYLFNYLMLSQAIFDFSIKKSGKLNLLSLNQKKNKIIQEHENIEISSFICKDHFCNDLIINIRKDNNINLLSSSYTRLSKWNNNMDKRISLENTISCDLINKATTEEQITDQLNKIDITQLKFGSWSRGPPIVDKLILLFKDFDLDVGDKGGQNINI